MSPEYIFFAIRILAALALYLFFGLLIFWLWRDFKFGASAQTATPQAHLVVVGAQDQFLLRQNSDIGRTAGNVVHIEDETVSARHARLLFQGGQWWLEDLASRNGTEVNGVPVEEPLVVSYGDEIKLGRVTTRLEAGGVVEVGSQNETAAHNQG